MVQVPAPFTSVQPSPNRSPRQPVPRRGVVLHHGVIRSLTELMRLMGGAKQVSATCGCMDDLLPLAVPNDGDRPWSLSDAYWDSALRSVETVNLTLDPDYLISDASHWTLARAVAYWAQQDGFWPHRDGNPTTWTVIGHREVFSIHGGSYATACPGGLDLDLVVRRAQLILNGALDAPTVPEEDTMRLVAVDREGLPNAPINSWAVIDAGGFTRVSDEDVTALADSVGLGAPALKETRKTVSGRGFLVLEGLYGRMRQSLPSNFADQLAKQLTKSIGTLDQAALTKQIQEAIKAGLDQVQVSIPPLEVTSTVTTKR